MPPPTQVVGDYLLREEGISDGSVWRCYLPGEQDPFAMLEVLDTKDGALRLKAYPAEAGPWGNLPPHVRDLVQMDLSQFITRKWDGQLVRVD